MEDDSRDWNKNRKRLLAQSPESQSCARSVEAHDAEIDWQRVGDLAHSPRAIPVPVTGSHEGIDAVLAQSVLVENTLPRAPTGTANRDCWLTRRPSTIWSAAALRHRRPQPQSQAVAIAMSHLRRRGVAGILLVCAAWQSPGALPIPTGADPVRSRLSLLRQHRAISRHAPGVELAGRFHQQVLFGAVALEIKRLDPRATQLVLDTRDLDIAGGHGEADECAGRDREEPDDLGEPTFSFRQGGSHSG